MQMASVLPVSLSVSDLPGGGASAVAADAMPLAVLDDPQEWSAFSRRLTDRPACWESSVVFEGMHCAACALTIEDVLCRVPGVLSAEVSAASHRGRIVWSDQAVKPSDWMQAAQRAGYRPHPCQRCFRKRSPPRRDAPGAVALGRGWPVHDAGNDVCVARLHR